MTSIDGHARSLALEKRNRNEKGQPTLMMLTTSSTETEFFWEQSRASPGQVRGPVSEDGAIPWASWRTAMLVAFAFLHFGSALDVISSPSYSFESFQRPHFLTHWCSALIFHNDKPFSCQKHFYLSLSSVDPDCEFVLTLSPLFSPLPGLTVHFL